MPTVIKRSLKSWMLVYAAFALAITAANFGSSSDTSSALVSPGSLPVAVSVERSFFQPAFAQPRRNDI